MAPIITTYLITGANRGIGRALLEVYLARSNTTVIAAVRDPKNATSKALRTLPKGHGSTLIVVKIDSASEVDPAVAIAHLQSAYGITALDVVIANAGISTCLPPVAEVAVEDLQEHILINVIGPLLLFQAVLQLLEKAARPKFVAISSSAGSISGMASRPFPNAAYGTSKATLNYLIRKMHYEHKNLTVFPVDPGWVQTDMGNSGALLVGMKEAETPLEESVEGLVTVIDQATREKTSGRFPVFDGKECAW